MYLSHPECWCSRYLNQYHLSPPRHHSSFSFLENVSILNIETNYTRTLFSSYCTSKYNFNRNRQSTGHIVQYKYSCELGPVIINKELHLLNILISWCVRYLITTSNIMDVVDILSHQIISSTVFKFLAKSTEIPKITQRIPFLFYHMSL